MDNKVFGIEGSSVYSPVNNPSVSTGEKTDRYTSTQKASVYTSIQTTERDSQKHSCRECLSSNGVAGGGSNPPVNISLNDLDKITYPLCIRVPVTYKIKYQRLGHREKHLFKIAVLGILEALSSNGQATENTVMGTTVYNININVNQSVAKAENNITLDTEPIIKAIKELEETLAKYVKTAYTENERLKYRYIARKIAQLKQLIPRN